MIKILIVDDNQEDLDTMKTILEKQGYEIIIVDNGADALDKLDQGIDLILIDIKMPTLSGYDLVRLVRDKVGNKVKILYVTIVPEKEVNMTNVDGIIEKPFTIETFLGTIKKILE